MRIFCWILFCINLFVGHTNGQSIDPPKGVKNYEDGYIVISGTTNINGFRLRCPLEAIDCNHLDSTTIHNEDSGKVEIDVPLENFKADIPLMSRDFLKLVNAEEHPNLGIGIAFPKLKMLLLEQKDSVARFTISMAGISNTYDIACEVIDSTNSKLYLRGKKTVELSDFNIEPPVKFRGLVRVKDDVIINFGLVFLPDNKHKLAQF